MYKQTNKNTRQIKTFADNSWLPMLHLDTCREKRNSIPSSCFSPMASCSSAQAVSNCKLPTHNLTLPFSVLWLKFKFNRNLFYFQVYIFSCNLSYWMLSLKYFHLVLFKNGVERWKVPFLLRHVTLTNPFLQLAMIMLSFNKVTIFHGICSQIDLELVLFLIFFFFF